MADISNKTLKDVIRHFSPAWFTVNMSTGILSILFHDFPYGTGSWGMRFATLTFFFLNFCLYILFTVLSVVRFIMFPEIWGILCRHPVERLFICAFPTGAITLLAIAVSLIHEDYSFGDKPFLYVIWAFWWLDVAGSILCFFGTLHGMMIAHKHPTMQTMTSAWLLPVISLIVTSSGGAVLSASLSKYSLNHALITATFSIYLVSIGLSVNLMILTVYLLRLIVRGLPSGTGIYSVFLPLGPTGRSGYTILLLGQFFRAVLPLPYGSSEFLTAITTGESISVTCTTVALALWSLESMWLFFAILGMYTVLRQTRVPFKLEIWGIIFPNGVYANLTLGLAKTLDSPFFRVWGSVYAVATLVMWSLVASRTLVLVYSKQIFEAPSLVMVVEGKSESEPVSERMFMDAATSTSPSLHFLRSETLTLDDGVDF
ncbi:voltage-dependent anion channel [Desarmillaria ectypa]|nr:voltage-dependent anion channel [Desarmillaria ectypa]